MLRTLADMLLAALPASERSQFGRLLNESAEFDSHDTEHMTSINQRLFKLTDPAWDSYPDVPVVSINLQMPQRAIAEADR